MSAEDFAPRAHSLWRMRMAHLQQRFSFFWKLVLATTFGGAVIVAQLVLPAQSWTLATQCLGARSLVLLGSMSGQNLKMNIALGGHRATVLARTVASDPLWVEHYDRLLNLLALGALLGFGAGLFVVWGIRRTMAQQGRETLGDRLLGGTALVDQAELAARTVVLAGDDALAIGPVPIPRRIETRHFAFLGTTGSGKTTVLRQMLDRIEARGEAALVYDTSGEFIAHYYRPERGDVILNPFDARCAHWTPFDEISHPADADRIARQLVSETGSQDDDVWLETSRILVANMLRSLWAEGNRTLEALLEALQVKSKEQLKAWLGHTSSARTFADDADRATGSVLFMLAKAANLIQFLKDRGRSWRRALCLPRFHCRVWTRSRGPSPGFSCRARRTTSRPPSRLMACWLECAASAVLGLPPSPRAPHLVRARRAC